MNLTKVAGKAAAEACNVLGQSLSASELEKVQAIIAEAMEKAVQEASKQHTKTCKDHLSHKTDLAHKIQREIERKKTALIANLSSLR